MTFDLTKYILNFHYEAVDSPLYQLPDFVEYHGLNLDPDYQRDHVWTDEQAGRFVAHMITGGKTSRLLINSLDRFGLDSYEILDGKQRLTSLLRWLNNEIPAVFYDDATAYLYELNTSSRTHAGRPTTNVPFGHMNLTRPEVLELYIRLNRGGTVHTDSEIEKVRELLKQEKNEL